MTDRKPSSRSLEARLDGLIGGAGALISMVDPICGPAILESSGDISAALDALAKENPKVRQTLERALTGGAWTGVIMAAAPIGLAFVSHHILPIFGRRMTAPPIHRPEAVEDPHRPVPPGQEQSARAGWNEVFAHPPTSFADDG